MTNEAQSKASSDKPAVQAVQSVELRVFLEEYPLNSLQVVEHYYGRNSNSYNPYFKEAPQLRLWCADEQCQGYRRFDGEWRRSSEIGSKDVCYDFLVYTCRDCGKFKKTYCIVSWAIDEEGRGKIIKVGELPEVHIDLPSFLPTLLGDDYPFFIKGLKSEKRGLGIGAFAYYRRVVENQKGRLFAEIAKVARRLNASPEMIGALDTAAKEKQFSKAIDNVKELFPTSLLIDGHNPMKLLHKALSGGLHEQDDQACLKLAHSIRMVLQDLAIRIKEALREERELKQALSDLLQTDVKP